MGRWQSLGLLKSGKADELMDDRTGDTPLFALGQRTHRVSNHVSLVNTSTSLLKKKKITIERGNPLFAPSTRSKGPQQFIIGDWRNRIGIVVRYPDHSWTGWMIKCDRGRTNPQKMQQKTATNILWYGECFYAWGRITQKICIPSKILKISQWNRCSTHLRNW